jgi:large repetitive protein
MAIKVKKVTPPTISADNTTTCSGKDVTLTASGCMGGVRWSNGDTGYVITVNPTVNTTYSAKCYLGECASDGSNSIEVRVTQKPEAPEVICSATEICNGASLQLLAVGCANGTVKWSTGATGVSITVSPTVTTAYYATCTVGGCSSDRSRDYTIKVSQPTAPAVTASATSICAGKPVSLSATGCDGTITWSNGKIGPVVTFNPTITARYTATCTRGECVSPASSPIEVVVNSPSAPVITASATSICQGASLTLSATGCDGTITWSNGQTGASISVTPSSTTEYTATCKKGDCESTKSNTLTVVVSNFAAPTVAASANKVCRGANVTLTASGCNGTVKWSNGSTGASITVPIDARTTFSAVCESATCRSSKSNDVTVDIGDGGTPPIISADKPTVCSGEVVRLSATNCSGTVTWSNGQTGASISVTATATTTYTAKCTSDNCSSGDSQGVTVTVNPATTPTITVTASKTRVCAGTPVSLTASGCASGVTWSNGATGSTINVTVSATTTYTATCPAASCTNSATGSATVTLAPPPTPPTITCTTSQICPGGSVTLSATGCEGTVRWSTGATTTAITVSPANTTTYTVKCIVDSNCESQDSAPATITVGNPTPPTIVASANTVCAGGSITLTATGCTTGTVNWSNGKIGNVITVKPTATATYTATCNAGSCMGENSAPVTITVNPAPAAPTVSDLQNACPSLTVDLKNAIPATYTTPYEFFATSTPTGSPLASTVVSATGVYYVFGKGSNGCYSTSPSEVYALISSCNNPIDCKVSAARADAGADASLCSDKSIKLNGTIGGAAQSARWKTLGTGTFDNATVLNATYTASAEDVSKGSIKLVLMTNDPDGDAGTCTAGMDTLTLTFRGIAIKPTIAVKSGTAPCATSVVLTATPQTGYQYKWNNGTAIASNEFTASAGSSVTVVLVDANGCTSVPSDAFLVPTVTGIASPALTDAGRNLTICSTSNPTANLTTAVQAAPSGSTLEFRAGSDPSSAGIASPASVGAGVFYAFYKDAAGCFSGGTRIEVRSVCNNEADIAVTITADKERASANDEVTFTIKVKNLGNITAKPVNVTHTIPAGFEFVSSTGGLAKDGNTLTARIDSLIKNEEEVFTYKVKAITLPSTVTFSATTPTPESNTSNNSASATIQPIAIQGPELVLTMSASKNELAVGEEATFTVKVSNNGNVNGSNLSVQLSVPANLEYSSTTPTFPITISSLPVGRDTTFTFKAKGKATGTGNIESFVTVLPNEQNTANNKDSKAIVVVSSTGGTDLVVSFTVDKPTPAVGDTVTYTLKVRNNGPQPATNVSVRNVIPRTNLEFVSGLDFVKQGDTLTANIATLNVGAERTFTYKAKVVALPNEVPNTATLSRSTPSDSNPNNNTATASINSAANNADLAILIVANKPIVPKDSTVTYTITVRNNGQGTPAQNVMIRNLLPSDLEFISGDLVKSGDTLKATISRIVKDSTITLRYRAKVKATAKISNTVNIVSSSLPDVITANNVSTAVINNEVQQGCIGLALAVDKLAPQADSSYNVTFVAIVKNCGALPLTSVAVRDTLSNTFRSPVQYTVVGPPTVNSGSQLTPNRNYNGGTDPLLVKPDSSSLNPNLVDTIRWVVNVKAPNNQTGPFSNNAYAQGNAPDGSVVKDVSNAGKDPNPRGSDPTKVFLNLPKTLIGIAKAQSVTKVSENEYDIDYTLKVKNFGVNDLTKVAVFDSLEKTFPADKGIVLVNQKITVNADPGFTINKNYTGKGANTNLIVADSSTLAAGATKSISFKVRVNTAAATGEKRIDNVAFARGTAQDNTTNTDQSTDGDDPDKNGNLNPNDDSIPTRTNLSDTTSTNSDVCIAVALKADTAKVNDGSYNVTFTVRAKNCGVVDLKNVQLTDSLNSVFGTDASWTIVQKPRLISGTSARVDTLYNGVSKNTLLIADSSRIAKGDSIIVRFVVNVDENKKTAVPNYLFSATAFGISVADSSKTATDISQDGINYVKTGQTDPKLSNDPTPVTLPIVIAQFSVPEGFSPNGDGVNDKFVLKGIPVEAEKVLFQIYNRWGHLVYSTDDFKNVDGWDATSNQGVLPGGDVLPDGTYYIVVGAKDKDGAVIQLKDRKGNKVDSFVSFITVIR